MALYDHKSAKLGELEGTGYLFVNRSVKGESFKGVFFGGEEAASDLEALVEDGAVQFSGTLYKKNRSGQVSSKAIEMTVDVTDFRSVSAGARALLDGVEE